MTAQSEVLRAQDLAQDARALFDRLTAGGRGLDDWERHEFLGFLTALYWNLNSTSGLPDIGLHLARVCLRKVETPPEMRSPNYAVRGLPPEADDEFISRQLGYFGGR